MRSQPRCRAPQAAGSSITAVLLGLLILGCASPELGASCSPGDAPYPVEDAEGRVITVLFCTGPPGCGGEAGFRWVNALDPEVSQNSSWKNWCGCDGEHHWTSLSGPFSEHPPDTRWQWFGPCEDPCTTVYWSGAGWCHSPPEIGAGPCLVPVAPQCTSCALARGTVDACLAPDGTHLPSECCDCTNAARDADGGCVDVERGLEVMPGCCAP